MNTNLILDSLEVMKPTLKPDLNVNGRTYHYSIEQNSQEWHDLRRGKITASSAKVLLSKSKSATGKPLAGSIGNLSKGAVTYAKKKALERYDLNAGDGEDKFYSPLMQRGHEMEDEAILLFEKVINKPSWSTDYCGFVSIANFGCSPDRLVYDNESIVTGVEIKTALAEVQIERLLNRELLKSDHYAQVQFQMMVTGLDEWYLCSYSPTLTQTKDKLIIEEVKRDKDIISEMIDKMEEMELLIKEFINQLK